MIKEIVTDVNVLSQKSHECFFDPLNETKNKQIVQDMLDTAKANKDNCIGMAAIQIGEYRRIIIVFVPKKRFKEPEWIVMLNPKVYPVKSAGMRQYKEGCLSFPERMFVNRVIKRRYKEVNVKYQTITGLWQKMKLYNFDAVIAQHENDHLNGVCI